MPLPHRLPPYAARDASQWSEERKAWAERVGYGATRSCGNCAHVDRPDGEYSYYCWREEDSPQMVSVITDGCKFWLKGHWFDYPISEKPCIPDTD